MHFRCEYAVTGVSSSVDHAGLVMSWSIFQWHYIPEWYSECNTISISYPVKQPLTKAVLQTSINNQNVFKNFSWRHRPLCCLTQ